MSLNDFGYVVTVVGGVIAIIVAIKKLNKDEKDNAVEIANIKKDVEAQKLANQNVRDEMRREVGHLQNSVNKIDEKMEVIQEKQSDMQGDVKSILHILNK